VLLTINPNNGDPIYLQLVRQIQEAVASGRLKAGDRVPSHRDLAVQLTVNSLTVKRAFDELERLGLLTTRRGLGTFVVESLPADVRREVRAAIANDLHRAAAAARNGGLARGEWTTLADHAWKDKESP
jgi:GntR family transcriptional regulator